MYEAGAASEIFAEGALRGAMSAQLPTQRTVYQLYRTAWAGLDWLYPPQCGGCGKPGARWCADCQASAQTMPETICEICGDIIRMEGICDRCRECPPAFKGLRSWAIFTGPLRNAHHRLKYNRDVALGEMLARPLISLLNRLNWPVDIITAVPIGVARRAERGYNQATLLAVPVSLAVGLPYRSRALIKVLDTRSQVGLNVTERSDNIAGAFQGTPKIVGGKNILIVDDVATSGATMHACAVALLSAGASQVFGLTLARAAQGTA